jgi:hypothetical protein
MARNQQTDSFMTTKSPVSHLALSTASLVLVLAGCAHGPFTAGPNYNELRDALTFYASFNNGPDADFALGDRYLYNTTSSPNGRAAARRGLHTNNTTVIARNEGPFGNALRFTRKQAPLVFFQAGENFAYRTNDWSGTVSFWLSVNPAGELATGFCDPIQITPRAWNDAAFFVEFEKRQEIPFRLGVYADYKVWNPANRKWDDIPFDEKPLVTVTRPPFAGNKWTHVVFTFEHFNTGRPDGVARLYLDGKLKGSLSGREQTFTWDPTKVTITLGVGYIGLLDELSVFNRALNEVEIRALNELRGGVSMLLR